MTSALSYAAGNSLDYKEVDQAILRRMAIAPRISKRELSDVLELPLSVITARMQALKARSAVQVRPVISVSKAGRIFVFCKLSINTANLDRALADLSRQSEFVTVASLLGGKHNVLLYFTYTDMPELDYIVNHILMKIDGLAEVQTSIISACLWSTPEYVRYPGTLFQPSLPENTAILAKEAFKCDLDELDIAIISELQCNPQISIRGIARQYNVSPGTIQYRLRDMEESGVIRYISVIDHQELGLNCFLFLELQIEPGAFQTIAKSVSGKPWASHVLSVLGAGNLIVAVEARDLAEGKRIVSDIRGLGGIKAVDVVMLTETFKLDPRWGFNTAQDATS